MNISSIDTSHQQDENDKNVVVSVENTNKIASISPKIGLKLKRFMDDDDDDVEGNDNCCRSENEISMGKKQKLSSGSSTTSSTNSKGLCAGVGCTKVARSGGKYCIAHGGGVRCSFEGCTHSARGKERLCISHGGGNRCTFDGCHRGAVGGKFCIRHGGGKRCSFENCNKSADRGNSFCLSHLRAVMNNKNTNISNTRSSSSSSRNEKQDSSVPDNKKLLEKKEDPSEFIITKSAGILSNCGASSSVISLPPSLNQLFRTQEQIHHIAIQIENLRNSQFHHLQEKIGISLTTPTPMFSSTYLPFMGVLAPISPTAALLPRPIPFMHMRPPFPLSPPLYATNPSSSSFLQN